MENIYAKKGDKVKCKTLSGGFPYDLQTAQKYLQIGKIYTIDIIEVHNWHTDVYLMEIPDISFNSVFFENVN